MTKHKLEIGVNFVGDLVTTLKALGELGWSPVERARADFRALALQRKDLYGQLHALPDSSLGLTDDESSVLAPVAEEMLRNVSHALDLGNQGGRWRHDAPGFVEAAKLGLPVAKLAIEFDDVAAAGMIALSHPVIPGITPNLDLEAVRQTRAAKFGIESPTRGGIHEIETGGIHAMLADVNLKHSPIEAEDKIGEGGFQWRTVSFRFQRKS